MSDDRVYIDEHHLIPSSTRIEHAKFTVRALMIARPGLSAPSGGPVDNDVVDGGREQRLRERVDRLYAELLETRLELEEAYRLLAQVRLAQLDRDACDDQSEEA